MVFISGIIAAFVATILAFADVVPAFTTINAYVAAFTALVKLDLD